MDDLIAEDNPVRVIDALVNALDLEQLNFIKSKPEHKAVESTNIEDKGGRPCYAPAAMLKLYLYGYYNRIRSSRMLEKECTRNIEIQWLIQNLIPNYHTIADFRKDNKKALPLVFKKFTQFLLHNELIGGANTVVDGTKVRAVNSKKNNFNQEKISRHLDYIENKTEAYLNEMDAADNEENSAEDLASKMQKLQSKILKMTNRKKFYDSLTAQLSGSEDGQVSTTDPESRSMPIHHNQVEVAYNIQCATDDKNCMIVHFDVTNDNDTKVLYSIGTRRQGSFAKNE